MNKKIKQQKNTVARMNSDKALVDMIASSEECLAFERFETPFSAFTDAISNRLPKWVKFCWITLKRV
jgi:hypothetical protein